MENKEMTEGDGVAFYAELADIKPEIEASTGQTWVMRITEEKIIFNREHKAISNADDFALAVVDILEKQFKVRFEKTSRECE